MGLSANKSALVQVILWYSLGNKPFPESNDDQDLWRSLASLDRNGLINSLSPDDTYMD